MNLDVWDFNELEEKRTVRLRLSKRNGVEITAATDNGLTISYLLIWKDGQCVATPGAKDRLDAYGYSTDFCEWTEDGAMIVNAGIRGDGR